MEKAYNAMTNTSLCDLHIYYREEVVVPYQNAAKEFQPIHDKFTAIVNIIKKAREEGNINKDGTFKDGVVPPSVKTDLSIDGDRWGFDLLLFFLDNLHNETDGIWIFIFSDYLVIGRCFSTSRLVI